MKALIRRYTALQWLDSVEDGFSNAKHRQQWRNTLTTYAAGLFPLLTDAVTTEAVLEVLKSIWLTKAETALRVRGRIEKVLDAAKVKGFVMERTRHVAGAIWICSYRSAARRR